MTAPAFPYLYDLASLASQSAKDVPTSDPATPTGGGTLSAHDYAEFLGAVDQSFHGEPYDG